MGWRLQKWNEFALQFLAKQKKAHTTRTGKKLHANKSNVNCMQHRIFREAKWRSVGYLSQLKKNAKRKKRCENFICYMFSLARLSRLNIRLVASRMCKYVCTQRDSVRQWEIASWKKGNIINLLMVTNCQHKVKCLTRNSQWNELI